MQRRKERDAWTRMFWEHFTADESSLFPAVMSPYFLDIPGESESSSETGKWHDKLVPIFQAALELYRPSIISATQHLWKEIAHALPFGTSTFDNGLNDVTHSDSQQIWTEILDEGVFPAA